MKFTRLLLVLLTLIFTFVSNNFAQPNPSMLSKKYRLSKLKKIMLAPDQWQPFPKASERDAWLSLPQNVQKQLINRAKKYVNYTWPDLPATFFLDFVRTGNRDKYQQARDFRREALCNLVLAECVEGKGNFLDDIVNGIWVTCEESYWDVPAHLATQAQGYGLPDVAEPTVDIFASETGALLAWTAYLLGGQIDAISPILKQRIQIELEKRILTPCLERDDFGWMGFRDDNPVNNHNPWCNSNWLIVVLLNEQNKERRIAAVGKILKSLDVFIAGYPPDGGCDEGPGYWNQAAGSLFDCLDLLYTATTGSINSYDESIIQEMAKYIYRAHVSDQYFINFADASPRISIEADLAYRFGKRIGDATMMKFGAFMADLYQKRGLTFWGNIGRQLHAIFNYAELHSAIKEQPLLRDVWLENLQVVTARSEQGSAKGLYVAAKGGHNGESHNHNDVGNFIVYLDGEPMIIDVGVEAYTKKTFSAQRYEIWTMQSAYHNLPTINGVMQKDGREFSARNVNYFADDNFAELKLDIAGAYPSSKMHLI
ncbi:MAG: heparinase II/III-family protein [bacterium]|nr:heparinase II/III-family protein [bacterium]